MHIIMYLQKLLNWSEVDLDKILEAKSQLSNMSPHTHAQSGPHVCLYLKGSRHMSSMCNMHVLYIVHVAEVRIKWALVAMETARQCKNFNDTSLTCCSYPDLGAQMCSSELKMAKSLLGVKFFLNYQRLFILVLCSCRFCNNTCQCERDIELP